MKSQRVGFIIASVLFLVLYSTAIADDIPKNVHFSTRAITPFAIEGLTMDATGNFYTTGRPTVAQECPVWRIKRNGERRTVG